MSKREGERGFALLAVTIALAVLALLFGAIAFSARIYVRDTTANLDLLPLKAALDAGAATAAGELSGPDASRLLLQRETFGLGGVLVTISARPESSKVDLNAADPALIAALLRISGVSPEKSEKIAAELADWREALHDARPHGAEASEYLAAGRTYVPTHAPLETLSEVSLLLDGSADLAACLEPDVTLFGGGKDVELDFASNRVRRAAMLVFADRGIAAPPVDAAPSKIQSATGTVYEVDIIAKSLESGASLARQVVMRVTGSARDPIWTLLQRPRPPGIQAAMAACARVARVAAP